MKYLINMIYSLLGKMPYGAGFLFNSERERDRYKQALEQYYEDNLSLQFGIKIPMELRVHEDCSAVGPMQPALSISTTLRFTWVFIAHHAGYHQAIKETSDENSKDT